MQQTSPKGAKGQAGLDGEDDSLGKIFRFDDTTKLNMHILEDDTHKNLRILRYRCISKSQQDD